MMQPVIREFRLLVLRRRRQNMERNGSAPSHKKRAADRACYDAAVRKRPKALAGCGADASAARCVAEDIGLHSVRWRALLKPSSHLEHSEARFQVPSMRAKNVSSGGDVRVGMTSSAACAGVRL